VDLRKARRLLYPSSSEFPTIEEVCEYEALPVTFNRPLFFVIVLAGVSSMIGWFSMDVLFPKLNQRFNVIDESNQSDSQELSSKIDV
jgi:hypothetical protein